MKSIEQRIKTLKQLNELELLFKYARDHNIDILEIDQKINIDQFLRSPDIKDFFLNIHTSFKKNGFRFGKRVIPPELDVFTSLQPRFLPRQTYTHNFIEIHYVLDGQVTQDIDGKSIPLKGGDICILAAKTPQISPAITDGSLYVNILLRQETLQTSFPNSLTNWDLVSDLFARILYGNSSTPFLVCKTGTDIIIRKIILDLLDELFHWDNYSNQLSISLINLLFIQLLRFHKNDFYMGNSPDRHSIDMIKILTYIQAHYRDISLSGLAHEFGYTKEYLSRLIKKYTGQTFIHILTELKMRQAAFLLKTTSMPIDEIIVESGYSDKSHFFRTFSKQYNCTPQSYRLQSRSLSNNENPPFNEL